MLQVQYDRDSVSGREQQLIQALTNATLLIVDLHIPEDLEGNERERQALDRACGLLQHSFPDLNFRVKDAPTHQHHHMSRSCAASNRPPGSRIAKRAPVRVLKGLRLLIIDDVPALLRGTGRMLRARGATVVLAADGDEAVGHATEVDVALVDDWLETERGSEVITQLRRRNPNLAIVLMTGVAEGRPRWLQPGDAFLAKPFSALEAEVAVTTALARGTKKAAPPSMGLGLRIKAS